MPALTLEEARTRGDLLAVTAMTVDLDLDRGDERFGSRTRIEFTCHRPGAETFVDLKAVDLHAATLNGVDLDPSTWADGRLPLTGLAASNVLYVESTMAFSRDGQGLHRSVDPADGRHYVYGHLFLDAAPRVFACFDQPDLKAPYTVTVTAPADWVVVANGDRAVGETGPRHSFLPTPPLATYFVSLAAGPYVEIRDEHDGIPLGVYGRRSLERELREQAPQILEITKQSFDHYHRLFGIRYPWGGYDQVFVPEFNAGAMENPGCVIFRDPLIFRGAATRGELMARSTTVAHEMAHMWFGDLVTMQWWDDLWLNESFAEYMAHRTLTSATEFTDAWVQFGITRKLWGYAADESPSTHPVAGAPAPDGDTALANFDGISYAKGASVLRQLIALVGDEAFLAGTTAYLKAHAFGNGTLADFLGAVGEASGRDLTDWAHGWLRTAGLDTITLSRDDESASLTRETPAEFPADRPHSLDIAGFVAGAEAFRVPVGVDGEITTEDALDAAIADSGARVVIPNAGDLTWARVRLDEASLAALREELGRFPDPLARVVTWTSIFASVRHAEIDPRVALDLFTSAWPRENDDTILARVGLELTDAVVPIFLPPSARPEAVARLAGAAFRRLGTADPGSGLALAAARVFARTTDDEDRLTTWAAGRHLPVGLEDDRDFRWLVLRRLATLGLIDAHALEQARAADPSTAGGLACLTARAALPDPGSKGWAWYELVANRARTNYETIALARGFWSSGDREVLRPYAAALPEALVRMRAWQGEDALAHTAKPAFPLTLVEPATVTMAEQALARDDLPVGVRRVFVDGLHEVRQGLASRSAFD